MRCGSLSCLTLAAILTLGWNEPATAQPDGYADAYARAVRKASRTETVDKNESITVGRTKPNAKRSQAPRKRGR